MNTMPMYDLPPDFVPPMVTKAQIQLGLEAITTTIQNPLYTNTMLANLPLFRSLPGLSLGPRQNVENTSIGPIYPTMPRSMPFATPSYTNKSLATF